MGSRKTAFERLTEEHDRALFAAAFPGDPLALHAAESALRRCSDALDLALSKAHRRGIGPGAGSGLVGSIVEGSFSPTALRWLVERFEAAIDLRFRGGSAGAAFDLTLPLLTHPTAWDALIDTSDSTEHWVQAARSPQSRTSLPWLLERFAQQRWSSELEEFLFERLGLTIRWELRERDLSRPWLRFPPRAPFFHPDGLQKTVEMPVLLKAPLPSPATLSSVERAALLDAARLTLFVRGRETDPITHAEPEMVTLFRLERGVDVALFSLAPDRRLPLETYVGFLAAKNGIPIAYGGAWSFFDRAAVGVNVFEELRGGESAFLFVQVLRTYYQFLGARQLFVDPFQFGQDNDEALESGAFWFYYRLGFRPEDPELASIAAKEWHRLASDKRRRSSIRLLRRLAEGNLCWTDQQAVVPDPRPAAIGWYVTRAIAERFDGDALRAASWAHEHLALPRGVGAPLALPIALAAGADEWSAAERAALVDLVAAKHAPGEWEFARALQLHHRLRARWNSWDRS